MCDFINLGCVIVTKIYRLCRILSLSSFVFILTAVRTVYGKLNSVYTQRMTEDEMGAACCICRKPRLKDGSTQLEQSTERNRPDEELLNQLITKNTELEKDKLRLEEKVNALEMELEQNRNERSEMIGNAVERRAKENFNNTSDPVQHIDISKRFHDMFDEEWRDTIVHVFEEEEELGIRFLSKLLQDSQTFCQETAKNQLALLTNPCSPQHVCDVTEILASDEDLHNLYKIRRKIGQHNTVKDAVIEFFYNKCKQNEEVQDVINKLTPDQMEPTESENAKSEHKDAENGDMEVEQPSIKNGESEHKDVDDEELEDSIGSVNPLETYIKNCTDLCWQAAISDPPVYLKFDVIDVDFDEIKSKFYEYPSKLSKGGPGKLNTVKLVVWPPVVQKCSGGREVLIANRKGCVLLYDRTNQ